jgi:hypothetical protein
MGTKDVWCSFTLSMNNNKSTSTGIALNDIFGKATSLMSSNDKYKQELITADEILLLVLFETTFEVLFETTFEVLFETTFEVLILNISFIFNKTELNSSIYSKVSNGELRNNEPSTTTFADALSEQQCCIKGYVMIFLICLLQLSGA